MHIWTVHVTRPSEVRPTEAVYDNRDAACQYAEFLSLDTGVLAAAVTCFDLNKPGTRSGVAMYVDGVKQAVPYVSDCRTIFS